MTKLGHARSRLVARWLFGATLVATGAGSGAWYLLARAQESERAERAAIERARVEEQAEQSRKAATREAERSHAARVNAERIAFEMEDLRFEVYLDHAAREDAKQAIARSTRAGSSVRDRCEAACGTSLLRCDPKDACRDTYRACKEACER